MRCALLIFVAVVSSAAGHRYGNLVTSAGYALPSSVTSAVAATRLGSEETKSVDAAPVENSISTKETPAPISSTTLATTAAVNPAIITESTAVGSESNVGNTTPSAPQTSAIPAATSMAASISSTAKPPTKPPKDEELAAEAATELPLSSPPTELSLEDNESDLTQRRVITYDQRQEGQYNIRADLENFMIVLIPPSASDGINLLDLITKSAFRRSSLRSKSKRKHYSNGGATNKYRSALKSSAARLSSPATLDAPRGYLTAPAQFAQTPFDSFVGTHSSASAIPMLGASQNRITDFIQGRATARFDTPTNAEDASAGLHPDRPVDVLPPPYPLAYQHLIKPFHLEAEPTVIQALPPPELNAAPAHISGNYLDSYNQLLATGLSASSTAAKSDLAAISTTTAAAIPTSTGYYRLSRAIRGDNYLDSNRVNSPNSIHRSDANLGPIYRAEHSLGATYLYPPIDTPRIYFNSESNAKSFEAPHDAIERSQLVDDVDDNARVGEIYVPPRELKDDIEWEQFFDTMVKEANDSLCMPGQRRDSYGMCRQVEGY
ncbi:uncharacterized protein [Eurosta solidaginis]|uniref:uncharacterized protein n=1 Tax=Eurosta solidaginis TaxID=178769 RepID=UPI0035311A20